jgi:hypothetical protein
VLATDLGYGPAEIDAMTLPRFERYMAHWKKHPTLRAILAAHFPVKTADDHAGAMGPAEFMRWCDATGGRIDGVRPH